MAFTIGDVSDQQTAGQSITNTFAHTVASGESLLVLACHHDLFLTIASVTFNGDAMTELGYEPQGGAYYLATPDVGTFNVVVTLSSSRWQSAVAISVTGIDVSSVAFEKAGGNDDPATLTVDSTPGDVVFDIVLQVLTANEDFTAGAGQVQLHAQESGTGDDCSTASSYKIATGTSVTTSWTRGSYTPGPTFGWTYFVLSNIPAEVPLPPTGGGELEPCINPDPGVVPENPLTFIHLRNLESPPDDYYFGVTQLNDDDDWYGGKKPGKLIHVSDITRRFGKNGQFEGARVTARIEDTDRQFRLLAESTTMRGWYFAVYWIDDDDRRAELEPFRLFAGRITDHKAVGGFIYEFTAHDSLAARLAAINQQPTIPPDRLTASVFGTLDPALEGAAAPIAVGQVSDQDSDNPQGVVPPLYLGGPLNFQDVLGGIDQDVDVYLWSKGAVPSNGVWQVYYNDPNTPNVRVIAPDAAWGLIAWTPNKPGWDDVGVASDLYVDYLGERYAPLFIDTDHAIALAIREGRTLVAGNIYGADTEGDGSGFYIDSPARVWRWILENWVFTRYTTGLYAVTPSLDGEYSILDCEKVELAHSRHVDRLPPDGYIVGFMLGRDGQVQSLFTVMGELGEGADMLQGINRHGQLFPYVIDTNADPEMTFTPYQVEDGTFETWLDPQQLINRVERQSGYLYTPPVAPAPTPPEGEPVPSAPLKAKQQWASGLVITEDTAAQTAIGEIVAYYLNNYVVRHEATAQNVDDHILHRGLGTTNEGPRLFRMTGGPWLIGENGSPPIILDLGSVFEVSHPERVGTATGTDLCLIEEVTYHPLKKRVTYHGRVLTGLGSP